VWRQHALIGMVLYAVFLLTTPFEHHDFSCELKTPLHCTACASTSLGADPHTPDPLGLPRMLDAGTAVPVVVLAESAIFAVLTGRSPPLLPNFSWKIQSLPVRHSAPLQAG
jgi:hypothetical protein